MRKKLHVGDIVNNLKVLKIENFGKFKIRRFYCKCLLCDNELWINRADKLKKKKDCGCKNPNRNEFNKIDLIGVRFGKLIVLKCLGINEERTNRKVNFWLCKCDCGKTIEVCRSMLRENGGTKCCGECPKYTTGEIPQIFYHNNIEKSAKARNLECSINPEYIWDLFLRQERKCALTRRNLFFSYNGKETTASLDRIDSSKGYIKGNVQWVHRDVNRIKNDYDQDYFISLCKNIAETHKDNIVKVDRPSWYDYFLGIACVVSQRSIDSQTKCGCVLVNDDNHIIGTGYNSFLKGMPDEILPNTRPEKYPVIMHAEKCALFNAVGLTWNKNITAFITMQPCLDCLSSMIASNIKKIVVIDREVSEKTLEHKDYWELFLHHSGIEYIKMKPKLDWIYNI